MARRKHQRRVKKPGLPPGTPVYTGIRRVEVPDLTVTRYSAGDLEITKSYDEVIVPTDGVLWVDIRGLHEIDLITEIGGRFGLHGLALEDIANIHQRPKFDQYDEGFLIIIRAFTFTDDDLSLTTEQVSVFCGQHYVLSFQEDARDIFGAVRERIGNDQSRVRRHRADYLCYALIDNIVDNYFVTLDAMAEQIELLEEEINNNPSPGTKNRIHSMKRTVIDVRKGIAPLREAIAGMLRAETKFIEASLRPYLQDLYDHVLYSLDMADSYRDILSGLQDLYLAEISFRTNKVMQSLTIVATIFIPLTFLAGVYGMNFDNMPELHWKYSYFVVVGIMASVALLLLFVFKRRGWL